MTDQWTSIFSWELAGGAPALLSFLLTILNQHSYLDASFRRVDEGVIQDIPRVTLSINRLIAELHVNAGFRKSMASVRAERLYQLALGRSD